MPVCSHNYSVQRFKVSEVLTRKFLSACQSGEVEVVVDICLQHLQLEKESAEMVYTNL